MLNNFPSTPEFWHVLINHLPIEGLMIATLILAIGLIFKSQAVQRAALSAIFICSASAWPVYWVGHAAYDRITTKTDDIGQEWLDLHQERADLSISLFSVCAVVTIVALVFSLRSLTYSTLLSILSLITCLLSIAAGFWIAHAGGKIMHQELRLKD